MSTQDEDELRNDLIRVVKSNRETCTREAFKQGELRGRSDELVRLSDWGKIIDNQWNNHFTKRLAMLTTSNNICDCLHGDGACKEHGG